MPEDTLSIYAQSQPGKLGVIDDRPDGTVAAWTYAELEAQSNRVANLLLSLGAGPGVKVLWCGPNSPEVVAVMNATRKIGAVVVPLNYRLTPPEALYVINHSDAEIAYVDCEYAPMFAALRGQLETVRHIIAVGGPVPETPGGMLTDADIAAAPADRTDGDLHLRHDRQAEGRGPVRGPGSGTPRRAAEPVRLPARRHLHHLWPAVPQRPVRVPERCPAVRPDGHRAAQVRRGGLAAAGGQVQGDLDVRRARAGPDDLRIAAAGQRPLRPLQHAGHAGQRGTVELRAQAAVRGGLPAGVAVRDLRVNRARRGHRADARGPDAQA